MNRLLLAAALALLACPSERAKDSPAEKGSPELVAEGKRALGKGAFENAIRAFKDALALNPKDASTYLLLADAYARSDNEAGALLTLKQAEEATGVSATIRRARADLHLHQGRIAKALPDLEALRDAELLTETEQLELVRYLAEEGRMDDAAASLEKIKQHGTSVDVEVVEIELVRRRGDELTAAELLDGLVKKAPESPSARVARGRYFLQSDRPDLTLADLELVPPNHTRRPDVLLLKARALAASGRDDEAAVVLESMLEETPNSPEPLALLAETRLEQGRAADAQALIDKLFTLQARSAGALYMRGRALEAQGNLDAAMTDYTQALRADPRFGPALSRQWRVFLKKKNAPEAMNVLEKLALLDQIDEAEKLQLATLYVETLANPARARKMAEQALRRTPRSKDWQRVRDAAARAGASGGSKGVQIIR